MLIALSVPHDPATLSDRWPRDFHANGTVPSPGVAQLCDVGELPSFLWKQEWQAQGLFGKEGAPQVPRLQGEPGTRGRLSRDHCGCSGHLCSFPWSRTEELTSVAFLKLHEVTIARDARDKTGSPHVAPATMTLKLSGLSAGRVLKTRFTQHHPDVFDQNAHCVAPGV